MRYEDSIRCDNCGVEITWAPVVSGGRIYCCQDCFETCVCSCGERMEMEDERGLTDIGIESPTGRYSF